MLGRTAAATTWSAVLGLLACWVVVSVASASTAVAEEVVARPADGVFAVEGHGWGHGRGMSQWGAQGAASLGVTAEQILSTYYPGTTRAVLPASTIRVLLSGDEGRDTDVFAAAGLTVTDSATRATVRLPAGPSRWRVTVDAAGLHLQSLTGATWTPYALGGRTSLTGPVRFSGPPLVRVAYPGGGSRDYRGSVSAVRASTTTLQTVVVLPLEDYLLGVVPLESSPSWRPAALQAQAVAARSYSAHKRAKVAGRGSYDICDTTACQVFGGTSAYTAGGTRTAVEHAATNAAVLATAGVVRTSGGVPIFAEFGSSNGGWSTAGDAAYLRAARDDWDGVLPSAVHSWRATLHAADLERAFPAVGSLTRIRVTARDGNGAWGGRVSTVVLEGVSRTGAATRVTTTGAGVYGARRWPALRDGLRSSWWRLVPTAVTPAPVLTPAQPALPAVPSTDSAVVAVSRPPSLVRPPGRSSGTLTATFRNTGSAAWPVAGLQLLRTGVPDVFDPLVGPATSTRVTAPGAGPGTVAPGQTVTLSLRADARPSQVRAGRHVRAYRLRIGTGPAFGASVTWLLPVSEPLPGTRRARTLLR